VTILSRSSVGAGDEGCVEAFGSSLTRGKGILAMGGAAVAGDMKIK
jgi:hypothetical protein